MIPLRSMAHSPLAFALALLVSSSAAALAPGDGFVPTVPGAPAGPDFSVESPDELTSVEALHDLLRSALVPGEAATCDGHAPLAENLASCRATGEPQILVEFTDGAFTCSDGVTRVTIRETRHTAPLRRLFDRLDLHLPGRIATPTVVAGRIALRGGAIARVELSYADGTSRDAFARDLGHPFSGEGSSPVMPDPAARRRALLGYYVGNPSGASHATLLAQGHRMTYLSPAWYWLDPERPGLFKKDPNFGAFTDDEVREVVKVAHGKGVKVLVLFHNMTAGGATAAKDLLHRILTEPALRETCLADIVNIVRTFGFDGVNMDFESLHLMDKANYAEFMRLLRERLAPLGKLTTIAVPAKFSDADNTWNGPFDYAKMGEVCDFVMVMTYDEHGSWSKPGPVASLPWVEKAIQYAVSRVPPAKVVMGFPTYGRDWTDDGACKSISCLNAELLIKNQNLTPKWDEYFATPCLEYTDAAGKRHTIWYENRQSLAMKLRLLEKYGLHGAGMWRLGMEAPDFWSIPF